MASKVLDNNGKELAPCIISYARYALNIKSTRPINTKTCTANYWKKTVLKIAEITEPKTIDEKTITKALLMYGELISRN